MSTEQVARHQHGAFGRLNTEWDSICSDAASARTLERWTVLELSLEQVRSFADFQVAARRNADAVFGALLQLNHEGEALAGRVLLQLMLPKTVLLARSQYARMEQPDANAAAIACMWQAIQWLTGRSPRPQCATRLAMHCLHHLVRNTWVRPPSETPTWLGREFEDRHPDLVEAPPRTTALDIGVYNVLSEALGHQLISRKDAQLLAEVYGCGRVDRGEIAAKYGLSEAALRQRCSRALRSLSGSAHLLAPAVA